MVSDTFLKLWITFCGVVLWGGRTLYGNLPYYNITAEKIYLWVIRETTVGQHAVACYEIITESKMG